MTQRPERDHDVRTFGGIPYRWNWRKVFADVWNPNEPRVFPPKQFGVGWGVNFHALLQWLCRGSNR